MKWQTYLLAAALLTLVPSAYCEGVVGGDDSDAPAAPSATSNQLPECDYSGNVISPNNSQILKLKQAKDGTIGDALVTGTYVKSYRAKHGGIAFELQIGSGKTDTVEIYHSGTTGQRLPSLKKGDKISVCGRYETNRNGFYEDPKSPDGGYIIGTEEPPPNGYGAYNHGYIFINGQIYN